MATAATAGGGADVALLACTELSLLEPEKEEAIRGAAGAAGGVAGGGGLLLLDTALLHAMAAVDFMLTDPAA